MRINEGESNTTNTMQILERLQDVGDVDRELDLLISPRHHSCKEYEFIFMLRYSQGLGKGDYYDVITEAEI